MFNRAIRQSFLTFLQTVFLLAAGCGLNEGGSGELHGRVQSALTGVGVQGAAVIIPGVGTGTHSDLTTITDGNGNYEFMEIPEGRFTVNASAQGYFQSSYNSVRVYNAQSTTRNFTLFPLDGPQGKLSGKITSALTGDPQEGISVTVLGLGLTGVSGQSGSYFLENIPIGVHSIQAHANTYDAVTSDNISIFEDFTTEVNFVVSPSLTAGNGIMRFVLTWGEFPSDLDSHLKTAEIGEQGYHVYYADRGDSTVAPYTWLDVDDVTSWGPETMTVYRAFSGTYYYYIHNYSRSRSSDDAGIAELYESHATVQIYDRSGLRETIPVPESGNGIYWNVCEINMVRGTIEIINVVQEDAPGWNENSTDMVEWVKGER